MANILVVDDSILMRRNLKMLFIEAGHTVVGEAVNGIEAYREYAKHLPDLVTMDITMPVMNGIEALKKIIATYPDAKVIMISSLDQKNMVFEAIQNGAMHYILKPVTLEKILSTINDVLDLPDTGQRSGDNAAGRPMEVPKGANGTQKSPFTIDNKNGIFIISVFPSMDEASLQSIQMALQGFVYVKPLKVVFNFELDKLTDAEMDKFIEFIQAVRAVDGATCIVCSNLRLIRQLKGADEVLFAKIYTDLTEIVI
jgi:DNA-binding NarL/FixJ family response regulator